MSRRYPSLFCFLLSIVLSSASMADISGTIYDDYDQDGVRNPGELGIFGVQVAAYDASNLLIDSVTTDSAGQYTLTTGAGAYRVEFTLPVALSHYREGVNLAGSENTSVVFVDDGASAVDYALHVPAEFCSSNPEVVTTCYVGGAHDDPTAGAMNEGTDDLGAIVIFDRVGANEARNSYLENIDMVGATWGLAVQRAPAGQNALVFAGAFMKRLTDYGPGFDADGVGGVTLDERAGTIYVLDSGNRDAGATVVDHIVIPNASNGTVRAIGPAAETNPNWDRDSSTYAAVGKESLGDIEVSDDGDTLWAVNLADRHLYQVDLSGGLGSFGAPVDLGAIPGPGCAGGDAVDWRPFALAYHHGALYIGGVCTGEANNNDPVKHQINDGGLAGDGNDDWRTVLSGTDNISEVSAHVLRVTSALPGSASSLGVSQIFSQNDLSQNRGSAGFFSTDNLERMPGRWYAWVSAFDRQLFYLDTNDFRYTAHYPQPLLADLEFDRDGSLILGFRDRFSDQMGEFAGNPGLGGLNDPADPYGNCGPHSGGCSEDATADGDFFWTTNSQGDINRACWIPNPAGSQMFGGEPGDWEWESPGGNCPTNGRSSNELDPADYSGPPAFAPGVATDEWYPGDGESFFGNGVHQERSLGGLATYPVLGEVVVSTMDPHAANTGGVSYLSNSDGSELGEYQVYLGSGSNDGGLFGKGAGIGDVELICAQAPLEIGNRIWIDSGSTTGVQDAGEAPAPDGVTVYLYDAGNNLVGQTTSSNGRYYFGGASNSGMIGVNVLQPGATYTVAIDPADASISGLSLTTANVSSGTGSEARDSDASVLSAGGAPFDGFWGMSTGALGQAGEHDHRFDIGLVAAPALTYDLALRKRLQSGGLVAIGDPVIFTLSVFNQGDITANTIEIIDYVDTLMWQPFDVALNPAGTTAGGAALPYTWAADGTDGRLVINGAFAAGVQIDVPVTLVVAATAVGTLSNFAEIDIDDGDDSDSVPDQDEGDGNGDALVDDEINNNGGDQDDHDVATVTLGELYTIPTLGGWGLLMMVLFLMWIATRRMQQLHGRRS